MNAEVLIENLVATGSLKASTSRLDQEKPPKIHDNVLSKMNIHIEAGGFHFLAQTNPEAPITVAAFLKLLPYRQKLIHVRWSGEGCWVPLGDFVLEQDGKAIGFENATSYPAPGEILFYPGGYSETEIILAYGACCFASKLGQLAGNHFLTIIEGQENLRALGKKTLWQGAQDVVFSLAPSAAT